MTGGGAGEGGVGEGERANIQQQQIHSMPVPNLFFQMFRSILGQVNQQALTALKAKEQEEARRERKREQGRVRAQRFRDRNAERRRLLTAVEVTTNMRGEDHPETLSCLSDFAQFRFREGEHEEAIDIETRVLEKRKQQLGEDHPDTRTSEKTLDLLRAERDREASARGVGGKRKRILLQRSLRDAEKDLCETRLAAAVDHAPATALLRQAFPHVMTTSSAVLCRPCAERHLRTDVTSDDPPPQIMAKLTLNNEELKKARSEHKREQQRVSMQNLRNQRKKARLEERR